MGSFLTNMSLARGYLKENIFIVNSINQYIPMYHLTLVGLVLIPIIIRPANWKDTQVLVVRKQLTKFTASRLALLTWKMKCFIYNIVIQKSYSQLICFKSGYSTTILTLISCRHFSLATKEFHFPTHLFCKPLKLKLPSHRDTKMSPKNLAETKEGSNQGKQKMLCIHALHMYIIISSVADF